MHDEKLLDKLKRSHSFEMIEDEEDSKEAKVTKQIRSYLKLRPGVWHFKNHPGMSEPGIPDLICCVYGFFLAIEVKRKSGKLTEKQKMKCKEIDDIGGGKVIISYGFNDFKEQFEKVYVFIKAIKDTVDRVHRKLVEPGGDES